MLPFVTANDALRGHTLKRILTGPQAIRKASHSGVPTSRRFPRVYEFERTQCQLPHNSPNVDQSNLLTVFQFVRPRTA